MHHASSTGINMTTIADMSIKNIESIYNIRQKIYDLGLLCGLQKTLLARLASSISSIQNTAAILVIYAPDIITLSVFKRKSSDDL